MAPKITYHQQLVFHWTPSEKSKFSVTLYSSNPKSQKIMTLDELYSIGYEVFNQEMGKFHRWLRKPNPALGGAHPGKLMETTNGRNEVHDLLVGLDHGIFA